MSAEGLRKTLDVVAQSLLSAADKRKIEILLRLISKSAAAMSGFELQAARVAAGLSPIQASKLIGVALEDLALWEVGAVKPGANDVKAIDDIYGLGDDPGEAAGEAPSGSQ